MIGINLGGNRCCGVPAGFSSLCLAQAKNLADARKSRAKDLVPGLHVGEQVDDTVAVSHLVVVPGGKVSERDVVDCGCGSYQDTSLTKVLES